MCASHRALFARRWSAATMPARPFVPTDEQRRLVKAMASVGVPHDDIARVVRCRPPTLRKTFRHELDAGTVEANTRVAACLHQQATTPGNIAAAIFWLKARAGWREQHQVELSGPPAGEAPVQVVIRRFTPLPEDTTSPSPTRLIEGSAG
jgi:hypothetical protein